jgi:hypothetical protein
MADDYVTHDEMDAASHRDATGTALIYVTTLLLLAAIFLYQKATAEHFNAGMFGGGTPVAR